MITGLIDPVISNEQRCLQPNDERRTWAMKRFRKLILARRKNIAYPIQDVLMDECTSMLISVNMLNSNENV
ncbi:hypothetical protein PMSM_10645 [Paenibacillus macquariensis subsp. macquariensis]|uniref:Uncharacterized protein n=1 Tax=Paenibacillus macquariensis TaxID=948756 RepID=A0ABY1KGI6_9BACL|nr:hypothetical protein PMSM_10645 [Paenibacillus macquariensis subsp. macquariensis]SIR62941.1 hypothetical protein SAMN05421578_12449 [Paenibacillus macquariensis]